MRPAPIALHAMPHPDADPPSAPELPLPRGIGGPDDVHRQSNALRELKDVAIRCQHENWDDDSARALSPAVIARARRAILALPSWCPCPEVSGEPLGTVSLDWHTTEDSYLALSVDEHGEFGYSWVRGEHRAYGILEGPIDLPFAAVILLHALLPGSPTPPPFPAQPAECPMDGDAT